MYILLIRVILFEQHLLVLINVTIASWTVDFNEQ